MKTKYIGNAKRFKNRRRLTDDDPRTLHPTKGYRRKSAWLQSFNA